MACRRWSYTTSMPSRSRSAPTDATSSWASPTAATSGSRCVRRHTTAGRGKGSRFAAVGTRARSRNHPCSAHASDEGCVRGRSTTLVARAPHVYRLGRASLRCGLAHRAFDRCSRLAVDGETRNGDALPGLREPDIGHAGVLSLARRDRREGRVATSSRGVRRSGCSWPRSDLAASEPAASWI